MAKKESMKAPIDAVKPVMNAAPPMSSSPKAAVQENPTTTVAKMKK